MLFFFLKSNVKNRMTKNKNGENGIDLFVYMFSIQNKNLKKNTKKPQKPPVRPHSYTTMDLLLFSSLMQNSSAYFFWEREGTKLLVLSGAAAPRGARSRLWGGLVWSTTFKGGIWNKNCPFLPARSTVCNSGISYLSVSSFSQHSIWQKQNK